MMVCFYFSFLFFFLLEEGRFSIPSLLWYAFHWGICNYLVCISCCGAGEDIFLEVAPKSAFIQSNFTLLGFLFIKCILMMSYPPTSQKKGKFSLCDHATGLRLLSFSVYTHYWEVTYKVFAWKILEKLQRTEGTHGVLQIQLGLGILSRDGPKSYNQAKIQDLPVWTSELWKNRLTTTLCSEDAHGLLLRSPTPGRVPWLLIYTAAESTEISNLAQGGVPQTCLFHQNLRPTFLPQCMLFTQFFIYIRHCWGRFLLLSLNTQGSSLIPALKHWGSQSWKSIQEVPFAGFVTSDWITYPQLCLPNYKIGAIILIFQRWYEAY